MCLVVVEVEVDSTPMSPHPHCAAQQAEVLAEDNVHVIVGYA